MWGTLGDVTYTSEEQHEPEAVSCILDFWEGCIFFWGSTGTQDFLWLILNFLKMLQLACTLTFEATHAASCETGINHPNQYFVESRKIFQSKVNFTLLLLGMRQFVPAISVVLFILSVKILVRMLITIV